MPQVSITINRPEVSVSTTQSGPTVTISETPVAITQNTSEIAVTTNPQVVQINTAATTIQTTTLDEAFKGEFSIDVIYHRGDLVRYEQGVYVYINTTPQQTSAPDVATDLWVLLFSESGLTGPQVEGINRAINMKTWNATTPYSVGDVVMVRQDYLLDAGLTVPYFTLYRLYHSSGSINVEPINHSSPPTIVDGEPVFNTDSAWQNLSGVRSINGFSGDIDLQEILDTGLALNATTFHQGSAENHGSFEAFADSAYFYGDTLYIGQNVSISDVGFVLSNVGGAGVVVIDAVTGRLKFSNDLTNYYNLPTSTDDIAEGTTNKYYTTTRANTDFDSRLATKTTSDLAEGTNLYYTTTRANSDFDSRLATKDTDDLAEGTNLYYTDGRFDTRLATKTTTNLAEGTNLYYTDGRFDTRLATKTTTNLAEGTNLYYTTTRANADFDTRLATKSTTNLAEGTNLYYTTTRANSDFDTRLATKSTTNLAEGTNLYYTNSRARSALSGSTGITYNNTTGAIAIDDTVVATHAYVGTQIANLVDSAPSTLDTLNELAAALGDDPNFATTITTALGSKLNTADFTTTANTWYAISNPIQNNTTDDLTEGTTNLYHTPDRARNSISGGTGIGYNATTGEITADVVSVNGATGAVYLDTDDISEGATNQYFTTARARASISGTGDISYNSTTGVISYTGTSGPASTDELTEGTTNLYYTDARSRSAISLTNAGIQGGLTYNSSTGVFNYLNPNTDETAEGLSNLYFTQARARESLSGGTGVTYDNSTGVISIGQSVGTGNSPTFAGVSAGNISVGVDTDNTIASTNTNGNIVLDPNGTGNVVLASNTRLQGELQASTNLNYTFPPQTLNTVTDNNGYSATSSFPAGTLGYGANMSYTSYYGDTFAGNATSPALIMRNANGNSVAGEIVPFTGLTSVAPSATLSTETMGTFNFNGYGTTGFTNDIATANQGGGTQALHALQIQGYSAETFSDSVLTLTSANITAVASSFRAALSSPQVTGTRGQISFTSTTPGVGNAIRVTGTLTGTATGIVSGNTYYIVVTNGTTTATLSATPGGPPITTTAGTLTGLTLTRCGVTFTLSGQTSVPFGRGAKVAITGVNNLTDGTYPVYGTPTATSVNLGVPHTVAPTLSGTQTFSCRTTYMGAGYRIRAFPLATPGTQQNRVDLINHTAASMAIRADAVSFSKGSYGTSGTALPGGSISYSRSTLAVHNHSTIAPAATNTIYDMTFDEAAYITENISLVSNKQITFAVAGRYKITFKGQAVNAGSTASHSFVWLAKNGTATGNQVADSAYDITLLKSNSGDSAQLIGMEWIITAAANDYFVIQFASDSTSVSLVAQAAQSSPYVRPAIPSAQLLVEPIGA